MYRHNKLPPQLPAVLAAMVGLTHSVGASAEGTHELGAGIELKRETPLLLDVLSPDEVVTWSGTGSLSISAPNGDSLTTLGPDQSVALPQAGTYTLEVNADQGATWDITVTGATDGRLSSINWQLASGGFEEENGLTGSFFALVPTGGDATTGVLELQLNGLVGNEFSVGANATGVEGANAGRSVPEAGNTFLPAYRIYLNPPEGADFAALTPQVDNFAMQAQGSSCGNLVIERDGNLFGFESNIAGTYNLVCDANHDGVLDRGAAGDLLLVGRATVGENAVTWNTRDNSGQLIAPGPLACTLFLNSGELHYVAQDVETSYPGFRMYEVGRELQRTPVPMFWNDSLVQGAAVALPSTADSFGRETSGFEGVLPGPFDATPVPDEDARTWGNFSAQGKGNDTFLDTFTYLRSTQSEVVTVTLLSPDLDSDGDGLTDLVEQCTLGTDPTLTDSDEDGLADGLEAPGSNAVDTDDDGIIDALDVDSDDDGVSDGLDEARLDATACLDADQDGCNDCAQQLAGPSTDNDGPDNDSDGSCDFGDDDDDNDGVRDVDDESPLDSKLCLDRDGDTCDDCSVTGGRNGSPDSENDGADLDGDGACDAGDEDDDNDGVPDSRDSEARDPFTCQDVDGDGCDDCALTGADESGGSTTNDGQDVDENGTCDSSDPDTDGDTISDPVDADRDGDGIPNALETSSDADGDGTPNDLDLDSDADSIPDSLENLQPYDANGDGLVDATADRDGDGLADVVDSSPEDRTKSDANFLEEDSDGDDVPNRLDTDDDGDGVPTKQEAPASRDTDEDGVPDFVDTDDDNDDVPTREERKDLNDDGTPDYRQRQPIVSFEGSGLSCSINAPRDNSSWLAVLGGTVGLLGARRRCRRWGAVRHAQAHR